MSPRTTSTFAPPVSSKLIATNEEDGKTLRRYWTTACQACALKGKCTTGKERRISRWEHEAVFETFPRISETATTTDVLALLKQRS